MTDKKPMIERLKSAAKKTLNTFTKPFGYDLTACFDEGDTRIEFPIDMEGDTVWATQQQIADLFGVDRSVVGKHIKNVFDTNELERGEATCAKIAQVRSEGSRSVSRDVEHYSLDVILAVGYRVSGKRATAFRQWASRVLKGYIQDGYALNGKRLNSDPAALLKLAQEVRAIRTSEKNLYAQVRETFAQCSIDYDKDDPAARKFFMTCQDTFHFAASEQTAIQIIMSRADASKPNMGLVALGNRKPTAEDVTVAKNYCSATELKKMELIGEAWLLYAEAMAVQGKKVSMARLTEKLRELIVQYEFPVFPGYQPGGVRRKEADKWAKGQLELFKRNGAPALPPSGAQI